MALKQCACKKNNKKKQTPPMRTITRLQYVTAQTFHELTNSDSTCSIGKNKCRPMPTDTDRGKTLIQQNTTGSVAIGPRLSVGQKVKC